MVRRCLLALLVGPLVLVAPSCAPRRAPELAHGPPTSQNLESRIYVAPPPPRKNPQPSPHPAVLLPAHLKPAPPGSPNPVRSVVSTAYCETGPMADGRHTYFGAVAMAEPPGSRWLVLSGPFSGRILTVADRYGSGTQFDIAMPGECARARGYGRRTIRVQRV